MSEKSKLVEELERKAEQRISDLHDNAATVGAVEEHRQYQCRVRKFIFKVVSQSDTVASYKEQGVTFPPVNMPCFQFGDDTYLILGIEEDGYVD